MFSGVLSCTDTKTRSWTRIHNPEMTVCLFREAAERIAFGRPVSPSTCVWIPLLIAKLFLSSPNPPTTLSHVKPQCYNRRVVILCAWLPSLLGAITAYHAWHHPKSRVCFSNPLWGGGCSGCDLRVPARCEDTAKCSRGMQLSRGLCYKLLMFVMLNEWWLIWHELDGA